MSLLSKVRNRSIKEIIIILKSKLFTVSKGYVLDLSGYNLEVYEKEHNYYSLVPMEIHDLIKMKALYGNQISDYKYEILKKRIISRDIYFPYVVKDLEGNLYGYFHISIGNTRDGTINFDVQVDENTVYLFDDYTFLEKRGKGVHKFSVFSRLKLAQQMGYSKATVNILKGNVHSEKAYQGLGFINHICYFYIHVLKYQKTFVRMIKK